MIDTTGALLCDRVALQLFGVAIVCTADRETLWTEEEIMCFSCAGLGFEMEREVPLVMPEWLQTETYGSKVTRG